jgi:hypothetical protein
VLFRHSGEGRNPGKTMGYRDLWIPAFAGMTEKTNLSTACQAIQAIQAASIFF